MGERIEDGGQVSAVMAVLNGLLEAGQRRNAESDRISEKYGRNWHLNHVPQIVCADGFKMSVQASAYHYCSPRDSEGPWTEVEVGFPSERVEAFMPFIDGDENTDPTDTVYGYVLLTTVAETIISHGGFSDAMLAARPASRESGR